MARTDPRYLRFARALALVSGLAPGCALSHERPGGTDGGPRDAGSDAGILADAPDAPPVDVPVCTTCECDYSWSMPPAPGSCQALMHWECCAVVGPLAPPDLPA
jgi:hypothetical protein